MLKIAFCINSKMNREIITHTRNAVKDEAVDAEVALETGDTGELLEFIAYRKDEPLLAVICDEYEGMSGRALALEIRQRHMNAYVLCFSVGQAKQGAPLLALTNDHVRLSGYLPYSAALSEYDKVIGNIYSHYIADSLESDDKFVLLVGKQMQIFLTDEIIYFESLNKKISMTTINANIRFYDSLASLEGRMKAKFLRCHNSYLINVGHIEKISLKDGEILLRGGIKTPISQTYKSNVLRFIDTYKTQTSRQTVELSETVV